MTVVQAWKDDFRVSFQGAPLDLGIWISITASIGLLIFSISLAQAAVLLGGVLWIVKIVRTKGYRFRKSILTIPYSLFIFARLMSIVFSVEPGLSVVAFRMEIFFYILYYVVLNEIDIRNMARLRFLLRLLLLAALLATSIGFVKFALGIDHRLTSTTAGYMTLGMFLATVLLMMFTLGQHKELFPNRIIWLLTCIVLLAGVLFTFNRIHWLTGGLGIGIFGMMRERKVMLVLALSGVAAVLFVPAIQERFFQLLNIGGNMSERDVIWRGAWMLIDDNPFLGFGLRTFPVIFPLFDQVSDKGIGSWHNDYLHVYIESGVLGLIPFVAILIVVFVMCWKSYRAYEKGSLYSDLSIGLTLGMIGYAVAGGMIDSLLSILFRFLLALVALLYMERPHTKSDMIGGA